MAGIQRISSKFPYLYQIDADQLSAPDLLKDDDEVPPSRSISRPSHRTAEKRGRNPRENSAVRSLVCNRHHYPCRVEFCAVKKESSRISRIRISVYSMK